MVLACVAGCPVSVAGATQRALTHWKAIWRQVTVAFRGLCLRCRNSASGTVSKEMIGIWKKWGQFACAVVGVRLSAQSPDGLPR